MNYRLFTNWAKIYRLLVLYPLPPSYILSSSIDWPIPGMDWSLKPVVCAQPQTREVGARLHPPTPNTPKKNQVSSITTISYDHPIITHYDEMIMLKKNPNSHKVSTSQKVNMHILTPRNRAGIQKALRRSRKCAKQGSGKKRRDR